jgi:hypothetical protein
MASGASADGVNFGLQVTPSGGAPALSGTLSFQPDPLFTAPTLIDTTQGAGVISLAWLALHTPLQGSTHLGDILVNVPAAAATGNSYTVQMTAASASSGTSEVPVTPGSSASFSVETTYLIGDADPASGGAFGTFGNNVLNTLDLIAILRAITIPGAQPAKCSDLYDAMDAYPAIPDGMLNTLDLIAVLQRVTNIDTSRPRRSPRVSCPAALPDAERGGRPALTDAEVEIGPAGAEENGAIQAPLYLRVLRDFWMRAISVAVSGPGSMRLMDGDLGSAALVDNDLPGTLAAMWDSTTEMHAGDRVLLGTIMTSASPQLVVLQAKGNAADDSDLRIVTRLVRPEKSAAMPK